MNETNRIKMGLGLHLILDLQGCNPKKLNDKKFIYEILEDLPNLINMNKISRPNITKYPGNPNSFDKGGISSFILIAESHITIHTFIEQKHAFIDVFSCKDFDTKFVEEYLIEKFEAKKCDTQLLNRGKEFPKEINLVVPIVKRERSNIKNNQN